MKLKKLSALVLTAAVAVSMTACSSGTPSAKSGEKPVLNVLIPYTSEDVNNTAVAKYLEESTGYKVNYETLPQDKPYDKLNLIMSGGEPYDVVIMSNQRNVYANYAANGALTDLTPLIEQYGSNVASKISKTAMDILKINDTQYGIPNTSAAGVGNSIIIRKDWLDKLGLEMPETVDEFVEVLRSFKEKNPSGNEGGTVPLVLAAGHVSVPNLRGAFGLANDCEDVDGELVMNVMRPEFKEYMRFMQDMYNEGLIDQEFATLKAANAKERFNSGKAGAMVLNYYDIDTIKNTLSKIDSDAVVEYIPLLKNEAGESQVAYNANTIDKIVFIPKSAKHPEDAMNWINTKLDDEIFRGFTIGEEGVHYEVKDGTYYPILPIFFDERNASSVYLTGVDENVYPLYWQARVRKDDSIFNAWDYINNSESYDANKVSSPLESAPYIEAYDDNIQSLNTSLYDFMAKTISSNTEVDSAVDEFIEKWKAEGGEELVTAINNWYSSTK